MATTTNFGWQTPDDTDLVKDGAAAIRTLGSAIDTSLVDLKGGTTDQVLAKNSNTDMDFKWVTSDDANAIQNSIINAKGDLIVGSANDTPAILSAPTEQGSILVADSAATTGLRWQSPVAVNPVINGGMDFWQRGTSFTIAASTVTYTADRWQAFRGATGMTVSRQTASLDGFQYSIRVARDSGNSSTTAIQLAQSFETVNTYPYANKTITFSFWAKAGANYSPTSSALSVYVQTGTGTDQNYFNGFTGATNIVNGSAATLTTSWQRFSFTATVGSSATQLGVALVSFPTGTAGANDWFEITGVQLEVGSVATPFRRSGGTIQGEYALCQRYYEKSFDIGTTPANGGSTTTFTSNLGLTYSYTAGATGEEAATIRFAVPKRGTPSITFFGNSAGKWLNPSNLTSTMISNIISTTSFSVYQTNGLGYDNFRGHWVASAEL